MSVAKIVELTSTSPKSFEEACTLGIAKAAESIRNIRSAWVDGQEVIVEDGVVKEFHVHLKVTFLVD